MKKALPWLLLAFVALACNFERVLDPSLPTSTAPDAAPGTTPLPTLAPTLPPTPTPEPAIRIKNADLMLFYGDWDRAQREYDAVFSGNSDPGLQAAALLGHGRSLLGARDYPGALAALRKVVDGYPDSSVRGLAFFALGETYDALDRFGEAAEAYAQYLSLRPGLIDRYAHERRGDSLLAAGDYQNAINAYQSALAAPHLGDGLDLVTKIGDAYAKAGDHTTAIVTYQDVYNRTDNDYVKAQMDLNIGLSYAALGQNEEAYAAWTDAVENYPLSYHSYLALSELVDAGATVNQLDRGLVDYFAGQYGVALAAFDRYLEGDPTEFLDSAHYYRGLTLWNLGDYEGAIQAWQVVIDNYRESSLWPLAFEQKAYTLWSSLDDHAAATQALLDFVALAPEHEKAAEELFDAARIAEIGDNLTQAAQLWERVGSEYSTSEYGYEGFFLSGITRYRQHDYTGAIEGFQSSLGIAGLPGEHAASEFWIAKAYQASGDTAKANEHWQLAAGLDPTGYYSERARDILEGRDPFAPPASYSLDYDEDAERGQAEAWLRVKFGLAADTDLNPPGPLASDPRFWRGTELWQLGQYEAAKAEFDSLYADVQYDAANTYRLAIYLIDLGLYRTGVFAARQVLDLAELDDAATLTAPSYFSRLRFGTYYEEIVLPVSEVYGFDPIFFFAVLRQESLFEGFVTSTVGARGLMQIVPATGQSIAEKTGWPPNYTPDDLYRPLVSINFGADYLSAQRNYFNGDLYAALAAYNGGPGSAIAWLDLANDDPDLFVEVIRFRETRNYLRGIYEVYTIYRNLYGGG